MHAVPGSKHTLFDRLTAFSNGFGGDPINVVKMDVSKGKLYEFSGLFRRNRQYFDYDLLSNRHYPRGQSIPIGSRDLSGQFPIPQVQPIAGDVQHRAPDDSTPVSRFSRCPR